MRYAIISKGLTISQLQLEVKRCGGRNLKVATASKQVFCDLDETGITKLKDIGCIISKIGGVKADIMFPPIVTPPTPIVAVPTYRPEELSWVIGFEEIRAMFEPPLYGEGINIAIIGTGIRETHTKVNGRVVYSKNYTTDPMRDEFDHDTGICDIIVTIAPLCNILNLKVLNDKGEGTEEDVAMAIDDCITLHDTNPNIAPTVINLSLGGPDDGNPSNPLRVACRAAVDNNIFIFASVGNSGPVPYSITCPACERYVFAVGSARYLPEESSFILSDWSSRGPTVEGLIKPDGVLFGENIVMASSESNTAVVAKSGTSFATPFGSAFAALYQEGAYRQAVWEGVIPEVLAAEIQYITAEQMIDNYLPRISLKPESVLPGKDMDYGFGLPYGSFALRVLAGVPAIDISTILQPMMGIIMMGMLGMMIAPMTKAVK